LAKFRIGKELSETSHKGTPGAGGSSLIWRISKIHPMPEPIAMKEISEQNRFSPEIAGLGPRAVEQFEAYLALLVKWNARINLTAVRTPEAMVRRHFDFRGAANSEEN
jgi:hypothetical protein